MFRQKRKGVKTKKLLKVSRTQKKGVPVIEASQGEHILGLS